MLRLLGIDYGGKRIGLAIGDTESSIASPLAVVQVKGSLSDQVGAVLSCAQPYSVGEFVVGLPLNMDDTEGPQARLTRRFGDVLAHHSGKPVRYFDERLSSVAADELLEQSGLSQKKRKTRQDRIAAQVILQGFLDAQADSP